MAVAPLDIQETLRLLDQLRQALAPQAPYDTSPTDGAELVERASAGIALVHQALLLRNQLAEALGVHTYPTQNRIGPPTRIDVAAALTTVQRLKLRDLDRWLFRSTTWDEWPWHAAGSGEHRDRGVVAIDEVAEVLRQRSEPDQVHSGNGSDAAQPLYLYRKGGDYWQIRFGGQEGSYMADKAKNLGFEYLAEILAKPHKVFTGSELRHNGATPDAGGDRGPN